MSCIYLMLLCFYLGKKKKTFLLLSLLSALCLSDREWREVAACFSVYKCCNFAEAEECEACVESGEMQSVKVCESRDQVYLFVSEYVLEWQR